MKPLQFLTLVMVPLIEVAQSESQDLLMIMVKEFGFIQYDSYLGLQNDFVFSMGTYIGNKSKISLSFEPAQSDLLFLSLDDVFRVRFISGIVKHPKINPSQKFFCINRPRMVNFHFNWESFGIPGHTRSLNCPNEWRFKLSFWGKFWMKILKFLGIQSNHTKDLIKEV